MVKYLNTHTHIQFNCLLFCGSAVVSVREATQEADVSQMSMNVQIILARMEQCVKTCWTTTTASVLLVIAARNVKKVRCSRVCDT